ncbi:YceI family protein, partial [Rhodothalassium salexigens]
PGRRRRRGRLGRPKPPPRPRAAGLALLAALTGCTAVRVITHSPDPSAQAAPAGVYRIDPDHTAVLWAVDHLGYSVFRGRFDTVTGRLTFDPQDPAKSRLAVAVDTLSLHTGVPALDAQLHAPDLFDSQAHPLIRFDSGDITLTGPTAGTVDGMLTLKGRSHPLRLHVTFNGAAPNPISGAQTLGFSATGTVRRSRLGLGRWRPAVGDTVHLTIDAELIYQPAASPARP